MKLQLNWSLLKEKLINKTHDTLIEAPSLTSYKVSVKNILIIIKNTWRHIQDGENSQSKLSPMAKLRNSISWQYYLSFSWQWRTILPSLHTLRIFHPFRGRVLNWSNNLFLFWYITSQTAEMHRPTQHTVTWHCATCFILHEPSLDTPLLTI